MHPGRLLLSQGKRGHDLGVYLAARNRRDQDLAGWLNINQAVQLNRSIDRAACTTNRQSRDGCKPYVGIGQGLEWGQSTANGPPGCLQWNPGFSSAAWLVCWCIDQVADSKLDVSVRAGVKMHFEEVPVLGTRTWFFRG